MRRELQRGQGHIVLIIILFLLLMAALGVVFYQNFIAKSSTSADHTANTAQKATTVLTQIAFNSAIYELDSPSGWMVKTDPIPESHAGGTVTTITNNAQTIQVKFAISELGVSQTCDSSDGLTISYYNVDSTPITHLTDESLYLVETMSDNAGGGYQYKIGLTPDGGDTHTAVGDTHCNIAHVSQASTAFLSTVDGSITKPAIAATIEFPKLPTSPKPAAADMQQIKDLMNTNDYKQAVKTLESARKK